MSDTTDDMEAAWGVYEAGMEAWEEMMEGNYWQTRDGKYIDIKNMEVSHIKNCLRILEGALTKRPDPSAWGEPEGNAAQDAFNSEIRHNDYIEKLYRNKIDQFKKELRNRHKNLKGEKF